MQNKHQHITEAIYIGDYEIYRKSVGGSLKSERKTVHISDDKQRIATIDNDIVRYQFADHLGSSSLELDENADIISYEEYYPFGSTSYRSGRSETEVSQKRYKYVMKELDNETGLYYYGARYYAAWIGRWTAVDPLAEEYLAWSPYNFCADNPVNYIDEKGEWIYIFFEGCRYKYDNGKLYQYVNSGKDVETYKEFIPNKGSFLEGVFNELTQLSTITTTGKELVKYFNNKSKDAYIRVNKERNANMILFDRNTTPILINPELRGSEIYTENGFETSELWLDIGHELAHRQDVIENGLNNILKNVWITTSDGVILKSEQYATHIENKMREETNNLPLRVYYSNIKNTDVLEGWEETRIINNNGESLFFDVKYKTLNERKKEQENKQQN